MVNRSELDHGKTGNSLEIAEVQRRNFVAEMQSRRTNQQILKCKLDAYRFLLALYASCEPRDVNRHRMHWYVARKPLDEFQSTLLLRFGFAAISSMHQFGDGHNRHADFDLALNRLYLFQNFPNGMASALGSDNDA